MTMYGFQAVECHGNMDQTQRLEAVEKFQLGRTDFLIATDLIARGLDITNVKAVINFSFPTEPKRFLHRIGRTARAGQHGVAITLCNDEERKELKKLNRKLNQTLHTFTIQNKYVDPIFNKIKTELDVVINDVQCELEAEREQKEAMRELRRSENMIKYKKEIDNRPRKEWFQSEKARMAIKSEAKVDLKQIKKTFEEQLKSGARSSRKREVKRDKKKEEKNPKSQSQEKDKNKNQKSKSKSQGKSQDDKKVSTGGNNFSADKEGGKPSAFKHEKKPKDDSNPEKKYFKKKSQLKGKKK